MNSALVCRWAVFAFYFTGLHIQSVRLYKPMGANFVGAPCWTWTFPSGAKIRSAYISSDKDIWEYLGPRYSLIGFDESTLHSEYQVRNMLGRLSSTDKTYYKVDPAKLKESHAPTIDYVISATAG